MRIGSFSENNKAKLIKPAGYMCKSTSVAINKVKHIDVCFRNEVDCPSFLSREFVEGHKIQPIAKSAGVNATAKRSMINLCIYFSLK
jgi:hypothetical protein